MTVGITTLCYYWLDIYKHTYIHLNCSCRLLWFVSFLQPIIAVNQTSILIIIGCSYFVCSNGKEHSSSKSCSWCLKTKNPRGRDAIFAWYTFPKRSYRQFCKSSQIALPNFLSRTPDSSKDMVSFRPTVSLCPWKPLLSLSRQVILFSLKSLSHEKKFKNKHEGFGLGQIEKVCV